MHVDGALFFTVCWLGASLFSFVPVRDFAVECFDRMFTIPTKCIDELVDYRTPTHAIAAQISLPTALQIFFLTNVTHDSR
jgi:hypothetical protein